MLQQWSHLPGPAVILARRGGAAGEAAAAAGKRARPPVRAPTKRQLQQQALEAAEVGVVAGAPPAAVAAWPDDDAPGIATKIDPRYDAAVGGRTGGRDDDAAPNASVGPVKGGGG
eukprot:gene43939-49005_t